jgi:hypothetical protein
MGSSLTTSASAPGLGGPAEAAGSSPATVDQPGGGLAQPWTGAVGLVIVLAIAALLGLAPGAQRSLESIGPVSTFCLPVLAVAALWWNGWPTARAGRLAAGSALTLLVIIAGVLLTVLGQAIVGHGQPEHLFGSGAETPAGHLVTFPWTVPLAAFVFVTTLQLTFVCRKWPFQKLPPIAAGFAALVTSWVVGVVGYELFANWTFVPSAARNAIGLRNPGGPVNALDLVAVLLCVVIWQMVVFFLLEGYPLSRLTNNTAYLLAANTTTIGGGLLTWVALHNGLSRTGPQVSAVAGVIVAGTLITGLLFEGWPARLVSSPGLSRLALLASAAAVAVITGVGLRAISLGAQTWTRDPAQLWVAVTGLNFIGAFVIVHAVLWRRWPLNAR